MRSSLLAAALFAAVPVSAQDMIGISWNGQVYAIDSFNATATPIGLTGLTGHNALAVDATCTLWATERAGSAGAFTYNYGTVDPATGQMTPVALNVPDLRGLSGGEYDHFWGVQSSGNTLVRLDPATGTVTPIGSGIGFSLQALELFDGELYGWSVSRGLIRIDRTTGVGTDVDTSVGGSTGIQFLAVRSDGTLVGGRDDIYTIDAATGVITLVGTMGAALDIRGAENRAGLSMPYGTACRGAFGPTLLTVSGTPAPNNTLVTTSTNHNPSTLGVLIIGLSRSQFGTSALPLDVDPIFGTQGCNLYTTIDATISSTTGAAPGPSLLRISLPLPPGLQCPRFFVQHAVLETGTSGSWTNGVEVRMAF